MLFALTLFVGLSTFVGAFSCSDENAAKSYTPLTEDQKAKQALDDEDFPLAIELYKALIEKYPDEYQRYPLLATAYAASAGVSVLSILKGSLGGGGGEEEDKEESENSSDSGLFAQLDSSVPSDPSDDELDDIQLAVETLQAVPEDLRSRDGGLAYSASAALLLDIYLAASSTMNLNKFTEVGEDGQLDRDKLEEMSPEDVDRILTNLESIAEAQGSEMSETVAKTLAKIEEQEGETTKERLINYIIANQ